MVQYSCTNNVPQKYFQLNLTLAPYKSFYIHNVFFYSFSSFSPAPRPTPEKEFEI